MSPQSVLAERAPRVLIFGAGGMLGRALIEPLTRAGSHCAALSHKQCDVTSVDSVVDRLREFDPNILINCAAHTAVDQSEDDEEAANAINANAVGQLALLARVYDIKLVHFSTDAVFDGRKGAPYEPNDPLGPLSAYARSKLRGELEIQDVNPKDWLIIRTAWLFGDGQCFPRTILRLAKTGEPLRVVHDQVGSPTFTNDLADATAKLLTLGVAGIWHIVNSGSATWFDVACETLEVSGVAANVTPVTTEEFALSHPRLAPRPAYSVLDTSEYTRLTGAPLRHWREALRAARDVIAPNRKTAKV